MPTIAQEGKLLREAGAGTRMKPFLMPSTSQEGNLLREAKAGSREKQLFTATQEGNLLKAQAWIQQIRSYSIRSATLPTTSLLLEVPER